LLGLVVGNQLGVPTERLGTAKAIRDAFPQGVRDLAPPPKGSPFDDDAAMTLLLAESLVEQGDFDANDVAERWVKWMKRDGRGVGESRRARAAARESALRRGGAAPRPGRAARAGRGHPARSLGAGERPTDQCGRRGRLRGPLRGDRLLVRDAPSVPRGSAHL